MPGVAARGVRVNNRNERGKITRGGRSKRRSRLMKTHRLRGSFGRRTDRRRGGRSGVIPLPSGEKRLGRTKETRLMTRPKRSQRV